MSSPTRDCQCSAVTQHRAAHGVYHIAMPSVLSIDIVVAASEASGLDGGGQGGSRSRRAIRHCHLFVTLCTGLDVFARWTIRWTVRRIKFLVAQTFSVLLPLIGSLEASRSRALPASKTQGKGNPQRGRDRTKPRTSGHIRKGEWGVPSRLTLWRTFAPLDLRCGLVPRGDLAPRPPQMRSLRCRLRVRPTPTWMPMPDNITHLSTMA